MDYDATWYGGRSRFRPHCVRWDPAPSLPPKKRAELPLFSTHVCSGQTDRWIKTPLGMEVGLGPGETVLSGNSAPTKRGHNSPQFSTYVYYGQNGWIGQDATWYGGTPRPRPHCVRWELSSPQRGTAPNFPPMSRVAKRLDGLRRHLVWR